MDARSRPAPRSLAEDTTRFPTGISPGYWAFSQLGQEMAQATCEIRDPHDPALLCSCSRAHYAPYFRWDERVIKQIVEMRFAPPENLKRVPGPRALLYYLPRDESVASRTGSSASLQPHDLEDSALHRLPGASFQRTAPPE